MSLGATLQGPRCALPGELPSITDLADCVFMQGRIGIMGDLFPRLFHENNRENLFVFTDAGRVVSHVGMVERGAHIAGCELHVACMGAVATYEEYRGRALASQLVEMAMDKARADGVDVMLISGDRSLYRRIGAFPVGRDFRCVAGMDILDQLHNPRLRVRRAQHGDLAACAAAYEAKQTRFVRPMEEWSDRIDTNAAAEGWHHLLIVEEDGVFCGYVAVNSERKRGYGEVAEFGEACGTADLPRRSPWAKSGPGCQPTTNVRERQAGAPVPHFLAGALRSVCEATGESSLKITLQQHDAALRECLTDAGAVFTPVSVDGAWTIVGFTRLMERLRPWIEQHAGREAARSLKCGEDKETCTLSMLGETLTLSRAETVQMIFGTPEKVPPSPPFQDVFPVPTIAYGIGYV